MGDPLVIVASYFLIGSTLGVAWVWREVLIKPRPALIFSFLHILLGWPFYGLIAVGLAILASLIDPQRTSKSLEPGRNAAHRDRAQYRTACDARDSGDKADTDRACARRSSE